MTEIRYRTNGRESVRQTAEDWVTVCEKAFAYLNPQFTAEDRVRQQVENERIFKGFKRGN